MIGIETWVADPGGADPDPDLRENTGSGSRSESDCQEKTEFDIRKNIPDPT